MKNLCILFVLFFGCFALEDKNILLPKETATDYVILKPTVQQPLKQLTVCLRTYTELTRPHSLFSMATPGQNKTVLILPIPPNVCRVYINEEYFIFTVDQEILDWKLTCLTWDSSTGELQLWINGKRYPRRVTITRSPIGPQMSVILGQDQDVYGSRFDATKSFVGEIYDVNMWDYVLSTSNLKLLSKSYKYYGNIFNWEDGVYELKGDAIILNH
ncbi:jeltraxin-like [Dendropsophus ebraccatus]|uniref:jeltraxin-like n=1 Tax=Dendropsophus ebraccatus TaxID=150705 RepID=UPI0038316380